MRAVKVGDETLSVMEIWGAEYQVCISGESMDAGVEMPSRTSLVDNLLIFSSDLRPLRRMMPS